MTPDKELLHEVKKLNRKLDKFTNPWKNAWWNFSSGIFRSLGTLFGTVVVAAVIVYLLSQFRITELFSNWFSATVKQSLPSSLYVQPSPGQP